MSMSTEATRCPGFRAEVLAENLWGLARYPRQRGTPAYFDAV